MFNESSVGEPTNEFVIVLKVKAEDVAVKRLDASKPSALYEAIKVLVNENYTDPNFPGEAGDWFAEHVLGYYKTMMSGKAPAIGIEDDDQDVSVTVYTVPIYRPAQV